MNCDNIRDQLSAFFDGELAGDSREQVFQHLQDCESCREVLESYRSLRQAVAEFGTSSPPESVWAAIRSELEEEAPSSPVDQTAVAPRTGLHPRSQRPVWAPWLAAAAAVLVLIASVSIWLKWGPNHDHALYSDVVWLVEHLESEDSESYLRDKYGGRLIDSNQTPAQVGYRPVVDRGIPEGYVVNQIQLLDMPCCRCLQTVCQRSDGSRLMILEHENRKVRFMPHPRKTTRCGLECNMDHVDDQLIVTLQTRERGITIVGLRDENELDALLNRWSLQAFKPNNS